MRKNLQQTRNRKKLLPTIVTMTPPQHLKTFPMRFMMILTDVLFLDIVYKIHEDMEDVRNSGNQYFPNDQTHG